MKRSNFIASTNIGCHMAVTGCDVQNAVIIPTNLKDLILNTKFHAEYRNFNYECYSFNCG